MASIRNDPDLVHFVKRGTTTSRPLGTGSYGSVEEFEVDGEVWAGKIIHKALLNADATGIEALNKKFIQECKLMASLDHPNITKFYGLCFLPECEFPALLMERLEGSLDCHLESVPNIPAAIKLSILEDIASGLKYLHSHDPQIIHRDLTAKNVLLTSSRLAKVTDFGNSRIISLEPHQLQQTMTYVPGTLAYMPPEAVDSSSRYGPSLDVFSFGQLALFMELQIFPGKLLHSTYRDPDNGNIVGRSEIERRSAYFEMLEKSREQHPFIQLIKDCLNDNPASRPTSKKLGDTLKELKTTLIKDESVVPGLCGIINLRRTSCMSCVLQCLSNTKPLREYFIGIVPPYLKDINKNNENGTGGVLARAFSELLWSMWDGTNSCINPDTFKKIMGDFAPRFSGDSKGDAQEFLTFLLDGLHEDCNKASGVLTAELQSMMLNARGEQKLADESWVTGLETDNSKIVDLFEGQLKSLLICGNQQCKQAMNIFDKFRYLSLPVSDENGSTKAKESCTLSDCLTMFTQERCSGTNNWYCDRCKMSVELMNKTDIWRTPSILIVYLKRFTQNGNRKLNTPVSFPMFDLDLTPFISSASRDSQNSHYDLYATINHTGSITGGYYYAHVQHGGKWYLCYDTNVNLLKDPKEAMEASTVYVLFYKKRKGQS